jgi:hypothetical protein
MEIFVAAPGRAPELRCPFDIRIHPYLLGGTPLHRGFLSENPSHDSDSRLFLEEKDVTHISLF